MTNCVGKGSIRHSLFYRVSQKKCPKQACEFALHGLLAFRNRIAKMISFEATHAQKVFLPTKAGSPQCLRGVAGAGGGQKSQSAIVESGSRSEKALRLRRVDRADAGGTFPQ